MRRSIQAKPFLLGSMLGILVLGTGVGVAGAQELADRYHVPSQVGPTVSVATLRVPEKAWKHFDKAQEAEKHDNLAESDRETQKAIEIAPNFAAAHLLRATSMVRQRCFDAAIDNVREARRAEPNLKWAAVVLASAYNGLHRYTDAQFVLRGASGLEAESWQAYYEAARAATGLKDIEAALHASAQALALAPENFADARLVRTNALTVAHRWSEAEAEMEIYLSKGVQAHRAEVLALREEVKRRERDEDLQKMASR